MTRAKLIKQIKKLKEALAIEDRPEKRRLIQGNIRRCCTILEDIDAPPLFSDHHDTWDVEVSKMNISIGDDEEIEGEE